MTRGKRSTMIIFDDMMDNTSIDNTVDKYIKSISVEEDSKRLSALHDVVNNIFGETKLDDTETRQRVNKDIYKGNGRK